jgi:hypothetical protein
VRCKNNYVWDKHKKMREWITYHGKVPRKQCAKLNTASYALYPSQSWDFPPHTSPCLNANLDFLALMLCRKNTTLSIQSGDRKKNKITFRFTIQIFSIKTCSHTVVVPTLWNQLLRPVSVTLKGTTNYTTRFLCLKNVVSMTDIPIVSFPNPDP